ncbi:MAG: hypothetical protein Q4B10_01505 [Actinomycetaceae bacterium]|nr:hypothetical protein [Actinomycetaceae bacterium]
MSGAPHLVVVGVGKVGTDVVTLACQTGLFRRVSLIDIDEAKARAIALDQHHAQGVSLVPAAVVEASGYEACRTADVIIVAAGPSILPDAHGRLPSDARNRLAVTNAAVIREVMAGISAHTHEAFVIIITNPLDVMVHIARTEFDYPDELVCGTGTALDSARLRRVIADRVGVDPASVSAFMLGEHGATAFPHLSGASVASVPWADVPAVMGVGEIDAEQLRQQVVTEAFDVLHGKGWTSTGIAAAACSLAESYVLDRKTVAPVCTGVAGRYGIEGDASASLPAVVGARGIERRLEVPLSELERRQLSESLEAIAAVYETVRP